MRTVSGTRNRLLLALVGVVLSAVGAFIILVSLGSTKQIPGLQALPSGDATVGTVFGFNSQIFLPILIAVTVIVAIVCLMWLVAQVPGKPSRVTFRLHDTQQPHAVNMESSVLEDAIRQQCESVSDVHRATVQVAGSARQPEVFLGLALEPGASVPRTLQEVYGTVVRDVATALETQPTRVSVELDVARTAKVSTKTATVGSAPAASGESGQLA